MAKAKVPKYQQSGYVTVETDATDGAVLGRNLRLPDGTVLTADQVLNPGQTPEQQFPITIWRRLLEIPNNIKKLAALSGVGFPTRDAAGDWFQREITGIAGEITVDEGAGEAGNPSVGLADVADSGAGTLQAITRDAKGRVSGTKDATITGAAGRITVANGDAAAGLPTIDLATVADGGGGALLRIVRDAWGRITGTSTPTTTDLAEGTNLYHTAARVRATVLTGLSTATSAVITAADTVLSAFGKLQAQISGHVARTDNPHAVTAAQAGAVPTTRTINTTTPLQGGGALSGDLSLTINAATTGTPGSMSAADKLKLDSVLSGGFLPTYTPIANVSSITPLEISFARIGDYVVFSGLLRATATAAGSTITSVNINIPVASNFTALEDAGGCGTRRNSTANDTISVLALPGTQTIRLQWASAITVSGDWHFSGGYRVRP